MSSKEQLLAMVEALPDDDTAFMLRLVEAKHRAAKSPLAYIEEMMSYQYHGVEDNIHIHTMEVRPELTNRYGLLHGGILSTFIDTAMGATVFIVNGMNGKTVTTDLQVRFLKEARVGSLLTAKTEILKNGRNMIVTETHVFDQDQRRIGSATGTFFRTHDR